MNSEQNIRVPRFLSKNGFHPDQRSTAILKKIKSYNSAPEVMFRKAVWNLGVRYRVNYKKLPGIPDLVLLKHKTVIFIDGDFWHGYNWEEKRNKIKRNTEYWIPKIERNIQRDHEINQYYLSKGWKVLRFWEHEIKSQLGACLYTTLKNLYPYYED